MAKKPETTKYAIRGLQLANNGVFDTTKDIAPEKTERYGKHIEILVSFGKDFTGTLVFDEEAIKANPDIFEPITEQAQEDAVAPGAGQEE
jgi:hypothetical protein